MKYVLLFAAFAFLMSCGGQKIVSVEEKEKPSAKGKNIAFESVSFSIFPGFSSEPNSKDVEVLEDGTFYYRLRERYCCSIEANYTGVLDSTSMLQVHTILASIDFNKLKVEELDAEHEPYISVYLSVANGEVRMVGSLATVCRRVVELLKIVESQKMTLSQNRRFSTAKDVIFPPPNFTPSQALLDSL